MELSTCRPIAQCLLRIAICRKRIVITHLVYLILTWIQMLLQHFSRYNMRQLIQIHIFFSTSLLLLTITYLLLKFVLALWLLLGIAFHYWIFRRLSNRFSAAKHMNVPKILWHNLEMVRVLCNMRTRRFFRLW